MPSGCIASTSSAGVCAGTTVTLQFSRANMRRMFCLMPKSYATTCICFEPDARAAVSNGSPVWFFGSASLHSYCTLVLTTLARSLPSIFLMARAFATSAASSSASPMAITPRITPLARRCRTTARRVDLRDHRNPVLLQVLVRYLRRTPVRAHRRELACHQTLDVRPRGLLIARVVAIVPNMWICQNHDLTRIGRIREDLLVPGPAMY